MENQIIEIRKVVKNYRPISNEMKDQIIEIRKVIKNNRLISKRLSILKSKGYTVKCLPMGSGGVGQVINVSEETRVQVSYGWSIHNYAYAVVL